MHFLLLSFFSRDRTQTGMEISVAVSSEYSALRLDHRTLQLVRTTGQNSGTGTVLQSMAITNVEEMLEIKVLYLIQSTIIIWLYPASPRTLFSSVIWCIVIFIFLPRPWLWLRPRLLSAPTSVSLNYDPRRPEAGDLILILIGFLWIEMWSRIIPAALPSYYTTIFYLYVISVLWHPRNLWIEEL